MAVTFHHFNYPGREEIFKWLYALADEEFVSEVHSIADWKDDPFNEKSIYGQLPVMKIGDEEVFGTEVIARVLAEKFGYMGTTDVEKRRTEVIVHCVCSLAEHVWRAKMEDKDKERRELYIENLRKVILPKALKKYEKMLDENNALQQALKESVKDAETSESTEPVETQSAVITEVVDTSDKAAAEIHFVGASLSLADLYFVWQIKYLHDVTLGDMLDEFPLITALIKQVQALPQLKDFFKKEEPSTEESE